MKTSGQALLEKGDTAANTCGPGCKDSGFNVLFLVLDFPTGVLHKLLSGRILVSSYYNYVTSSMLLMP